MPVTEDKLFLTYFAGDARYLTSCTFAGIVLAAVAASIWCVSLRITKLLAGKDMGILQTSFSCSLLARTSERCPSSATPRCCRMTETASAYFLCLLGGCCCAWAPRRSWFWHEVTPRSHRRCESRTGVWDAAAAAPRAGRFPPVARRPLRRRGARRGWS